MLRMREAVRSMPSYHPPLAGRDGLRMDFNENTAGCSPRVIERLRRLNAEDLARYPERDPVEEHVADFLGVSQSELLLTNGVDEAIHLLCETYLEPGDEAIIALPTYAMYHIYMAAAGARIYSALAGRDFAFPTPQVIEHISERTRLIAIANPNNPTGTVASSDDLLRVARTATKAAVLVDEAYFEFYGKSMLGYLKEARNLFVARTFSKAYGLAGLRIGALIGHEEQMRAMRKVCSPYNVNAVALACLPEAIADQDYIQRYVDEVLEGRARLEAALDALGIEYWKSRANFVLARVGSAAFVESMRRRGILVRDRSSDYGCEGCVRITIGSREQTDRMLEALRESLEEISSKPVVQQGALR